MLDRFVADAPAAGLVYPEIPQAVAEARFPGQKRTYAAVREGRFTGGNMTLLTPEAVGALLTFIDRALQGPQKPAGVGLAARFRHGSQTAIRPLDDFGTRGQGHKTAGRLGARLHQPRRLPQARMLTSWSTFGAAVAELAVPRTE